MTHLWLDANTIIRYLTNDPPDQASRVQQLFERAQAGEVRLFIDRLIAAEVVWALTSSIFKFPMTKLSEVLVPFLSSESLEVENRSLIISSITLSMEKNVDFIDAYLALKAADLSEEVATFDKSDFSKLPVTWRIP